MLNILVCVKQVPDINLVKMDPETGSLIRDGVPAILNPLDACALEAALLVKKQYSAQVTCISMGPDAAKESLRECLAAGADRAVLLSDRAFANADTLATSYVIASAAKTLGSFDLVFCGKESLDGATGQMAAQLAERFDTSLLSCVVSIENIPEDNKTVLVEREIESGFETTQASLPCLITVEKTNYRSHIPNLKNWKASRAAEITVFDSNTIPELDPAQIGDPGSPTKVARIYPPELGQLGLIIDEGNPEKDVDKLFALLGGVS